MIRLRSSKILCTVSAFLLAAPLFSAPLDAGERREGFDSDPGWEGFNNRLVPEPARRTRQEFGHRETNLAGGKEPGEIGGWIQRSITPAWYAKAIAPRTLDDRLTASGKFAVRRDEGGSGMLFGWFNQDSRGWRASNSLAFRIDGNGGKYWVFFEYGTRHWLTGGGATFEGEYQTTSTKPFLSDGTAHSWTLAYDPRANGGDGEIVFTLDGKEYRAPLLPGHRRDGAVFDRFGMFNQQVSGDGMEVYFDDLVIDGEAAPFGRDPGWDGRGNRAEFEDRAIRPKHDFGYSPTDNAGGKPGEIGGIVWRDEAAAYYAARTGPLSLERELRASGTLAFSSAGSDSAVYLGWFNSAAKREKATSDKTDPQRSILAIVIEGPSRIGHYYRPAYRAAGGEGTTRDDGPIIRPDGKPRRWSIHYSPAAAGGRGRITFSLDDDVRTMDLEPGHRARGAAFDRFGLFNLQTGGHHVILHLDDLTYTAE